MLHPTRMLVHTYTDRFTVYRQKGAGVTLVCTPLLTLYHHSHPNYHQSCGEGMKVKLLATINNVNEITRHQDLE